MQYQPCDEENPSLGDIARSVNLVHACVDGFRTEQTKVNEAASKSRHALANEVQKLTGDVRGLKRDVGVVKDQQDIDGARITKLAKTFGAESWEPGDERVKPRGIGHWPGWKAALAGLGVVSGAVMLFQLMAPAFAAFVVTFYRALMAANP